MYLTRRSRETALTRDPYSRPLLATLTRGRAPHPSRPRTAAPTLPAALAQLPTDLKKRCKLYRKLTTPAQYACLVQELAVRLGRGDPLKRLGLWDAAVASPRAAARDVAQSTSEADVSQEPPEALQPASRLHIERAVRRARRKRATGLAATGVQATWQATWRTLLGLFALLTALLELVAHAFLSASRSLATLVDAGHGERAPDKRGGDARRPPQASSHRSRLAKKRGGGGGRPR